MSTSNKPAQVRLEDQYQPLGIKAVKAAADMCSESRENSKKKPEKRLYVVESTD